jgi:hypothetical protein
MAVFCMSAGFTGIWWYPFLKSILEKTVHPAALAAKSSMLGSGYTSGSETRFNCLKSPHGRQLPSAFLTMCKGLPVLSSKALSTGSISNLCALKKSTPKMGKATFAKRNFHEKSRSWKRSCTRRSPQQGIG